VNLDDGWSTHPKVLAVSVEAGWLWLHCITYATKTDGRLTSTEMRSVRVLSRVRGSLRKLLPELLECHPPYGALIDEDGAGGYLVHDFGDYNTTAAAREAELERTRARQRKSRALRGRVTRDMPVTSQLGHARVTRDARVTQPEKPQVGATFPSGAPVGKRARGEVQNQDQDQNQDQNTVSPKTAKRRGGPSTAADPHDDQAREIIERWWTWFETAHGKKPAAGFLASVNTAKALLRAGHEPGVIAAAFREVGGSRPTVSALERVILNVGSRRVSVADRAAKQFDEIMGGGTNGQR
jgi:hypothetical protein